MALLLVAGTASCGSDLEIGDVAVLESLPHDSLAYTQGLLLHEGFLLESTGRYGESDLRRVDPETGEVLAIVSLASEYFGEGLARVDSTLVQLTWREGVVLIYDLETLDLKQSIEIGMHGWGLCYDGESLFMTSGGSILFRRDPTSLDVVESIQITLDGSPLSEVNELECVGDHIYGNVYQSNLLVKIEKETGRVVAQYDASRLVPVEIRGLVDAVLNGIAYEPGTDSFYLTGKLWPTMYRVRLLPPG